jgi:hypothetical protein
MRRIVFLSDIPFFFVYDASRLRTAVETRAVLCLLDLTWLRCEQLLTPDTA